jgi:hypothetical protein
MPSNAAKQSTEEVGCGRGRRHWYAKAARPWGGVSFSRAGRIKFCASELVAVVHDDHLSPVSVDALSFVLWVEEKKAYTMTV